MDGIAKYLADMKTMVEALSRLPEQRREKIVAAVRVFTEQAQNDAREKLGRPRWVLSRAIGSKVKTYQSERGAKDKVWGFVGVVGGKTPNKRAPATYGVFHERKKNFLKSFWKAGINDLIATVDAIKKESVQKVAQKVDKQ